MRRLPVYILADTSGSMSGAAIQALNNGITSMIDDLNDDPMAMETAYISLITFNSAAEQTVPLTDMMNFDVPDLHAAGSTSLWQALQVATEAAKREVNWRSTEGEKGDYKPLFFLMTDGHATDEQGSILSEFNSVKWGVKVCCGVGTNVDTDTLKQISDITLQIESDGDSIKQYLQWVTNSITTVSKSQVSEVPTDGGPTDVLPPIPDSVVIPGTLVIV